LAKYVAKGTGRRKTSVARAYLTQGSGAFTVNGRDLGDYFSVGGLSGIVKKPLEVTDTLASYDVLITVRGGGISGQADACRHGLSRALASLDEANHSVLRANGFLTRDSREVERKKYGQPGARRKFQFSKR
jgi:small subunit ribosomal protein S9